MTYSKFDLQQFKSGLIADMKLMLLKSDEEMLG